MRPIALPLSLSVLVWCVLVPAAFHAPRSFAQETEASGTVPEDLAADETAGSDFVGPMEPAPPAAQPAEPREHRPYASFGYGSLEYRETKFSALPSLEGLEAEFEEPVYMGSLGWEFFFDRSAVRLNLDFWVTEEGVEEWTDQGVLIQTDDLRAWRLSLDAGYLYSTYDRTIPQSELNGTSRYLRFGAGINVYYRHQHFQRDNFTTFNPPSFDDQSINEKFDMFGAELLLELEAGPRDIAAAFVRGSGGGGFVSVTNDALGSLEDDARINTAGVQGTIEAGIVSEFIRGVELRAGYRFHRLQVFEESKEVAGVLIVDLPDNQTTIHMFFVEVAFPF